MMGVVLGGASGALRALSIALHGAVIRGNLARNFLTMDAERQPKRLENRAIGTIMAFKDVLSMWHQKQALKAGSRGADE
jgi:hypothetical protein